ncbi:hypothetical protein G9F73_012615 [Clostridium estertheticum]|uniref:hypothetical protein n=1 Tax=Clostridium estertheticum TaxID=238834 RepID=UPI0013EE4A19|nr:hypothetical protein [Clostridium estertheticum]MBZ9608651.1 hypothetical protein [Clostridium estertheticum]
MQSKKTFNKIAYKLAEKLADEQFIKWCSELDTEIYKCLDKAWEVEKISKERKERIKNRFAAAMMERSKENE